MALRTNQVIVRKVFADELDNEFTLIRRVIAKYPLVFMDTEFPGTIFKPTKEIVLTTNFGTNYSYIWEFNFRDFDLDKDRCDKNSIELLRSQGIDFAKNKTKGIASRDFAVQFLKSGLAFNRLNGVTWISFNSAYDFGFLFKILTQKSLPVGLDNFMKQLVNFLGHRIFDIKHAFKFFGLFGGLENAAKNLKVSRLAGSSHQAGSDSLLILQCFMELKKSRVLECNPSPQVLPSLALYGLVSNLG